MKSGRRHVFCSRNHAGARRGGLGHATLQNGQPPSDRLSREVPPPGQFIRTFVNSIPLCRRAKPRAAGRERAGRNPAGLHQHLRGVEHILRRGTQCNRTEDLHPHAHPIRNGFRRPNRPGTDSGPSRIILASSRNDQRWVVRRSGATGSLPGSAICNSGVHGRTSRPWHPRVLTEQVPSVPRWPRRPSSHLRRA
jgi:hypothetical protein